MSEYTDWLRETFGGDGILLMRLDAMADLGRISADFPTRERLDAARAELRRRIAERKAAEKRRGGEK